MMVSLAAVRGGTGELVSTLQAVCMLTLVMAESFHQRRDHLDQSRYLQTNQDNVVKNRDDAEFVLSKYGYLRCQIKRRRREARRHTFDVDASQHHNKEDSLNPWGQHFWLSEEGHVEECDEVEVQKAIQEYQRTYNLPPTGQLDEETKLLMSTSRCGNRDSDEKAGIVATSTTTTISTVSSNPHSLSSQDTVSNNVHISSSSSSGSQGNRHHSHHRLDDSNKSNEVGAAQRLWKRAVNRIYADDSSQLLRVLKGAVSKAKTKAESRHQRHFRDYVNKLSRKDSRLLEPWSEEEHTRVKRSIQVTSTGDQLEYPLNIAGLDVSEHQTGVEAEQRQSNGKAQAEMFNKDIIRWRLLTTGYSTRIPVEDQRATLDLAFRMWSEVIPLRFVEDMDSDINRVDIEVAFGRGSHQNCQHDFDGNGGEIAHSQHTANMHFDDEENFKSIRSYTPDGIYLLRVAVHEIGHVLGLAHTNKSQSIMYAIYHGAELSPEFELSREDRKDIQKIYGVCKGEFSTVFDWVRKRLDNQFIYNTYFFRENHYWMYENHANRTRYGDPLYIAREWKGVPDRVDGYLHIFYRTPSDLIDQAYFFKGEHYFKYDSENDAVFEGYPRLIGDGFGPKQGQAKGVPDNVDTVFFDMRDLNIYFFKDDLVYVYDPTEPEETQGCCTRIRKITEEFPPASEEDLPLPDKLDAVYYSYGDKMQYFFKGENLWRNRVFDQHDNRAVNSVEFLGKWYERWMDICDVQAH